MQRRTFWVGASLLGGVLLLGTAGGCSDDDGGSSANTSDNSGTTTTGSSAGGSATGGNSSSGGAGTGGTGTGGMGGAATASQCEPLPLPSENVVEVSTVAELTQAVGNLTSGATILLADGNYDLAGETLWIDTANVTLMGKSRDATKVVLDGGYDTPAGGLVAISGVSDVTIAHLTLQRPRFHAVHITGAAQPLTGTLLYGIRAIDPGEQAIKINHSNQGGYPDDGEVACSELTLTDAGRQQVMQYTSSGSNCYTGGIDAHDARGWLVRDNLVTGFYCTNSDLAEHGVHFWTGSRDTQVLRNRFVDNARAIGFGLVGGGRSYSDAPCGNINDAGHYGGLVANNMIVATEPALFASPNGMDTGISMWHACGAVVVHNTVASTQAPFSSIEWRFADTDVMLFNNLVSHTLAERNGATAVEEGNMADAPASTWVSLPEYDLHLAAAASAIGQGGPQGAAVAPTDFDGEARPSRSADVGADQR